MTLLTVRAKEISREGDTPKGRRLCALWVQQNSWVFLLPELS